MLSDAPLQRTNLIAVTIIGGGIFASIASGTWFAMGVGSDPKTSDEFFFVPFAFVFGWVAFPIGLLVALALHPMTGRLHVDRPLRSILTYVWAPTIVGAVAAGAVFSIDAHPAHAVVICGIDVLVYLVASIVLYINVEAIPPLPHGQRCERCSYNLTGLKTSGCPECGWKRAGAPASATERESDSL